MLPRRPAGSHVDPHADPYAGAPGAHVHPGYRCGGADPYSYLDACTRAAYPPDPTAF